MNELVHTSYWRNKNTRRVRALQALQERDIKKIKDLIVYYLEMIADSKANSSTVRTYLRSSALWFEYTWPSPEEQPKTLSYDADDEDVRAFLKWLEHEKGFGIKSRQVHLQGIRMFFKALRWTKALSYDPSEHVRPPKDMRDKRTIRKVVSQEDLDTLLSYCYSRIEGKEKAKGDDFLVELSDLLMIRLSYDAGLRISSVVKLEVHDLKLKEKPPYLVVKGAKGGRQYEVPVSTALLRLLDLWLPLREGRAIPDEKAILINILPSRKTHKGRPVQNARMNVGAAMAKIQKLYTRAGIPEKYQGAHCFRHKAAQDLTGDIRKLQKFLGHKAITTTADSYDDTSIQDLSSYVKGKLTE